MKKFFIGSFLLLSNFALSMETVYTGGMERHDYEGRQNKKIPASNIDIFNSEVNIDNAIDIHISALECKVSESGGPYVVETSVPPGKNPVQKQLVNLDKAYDWYITKKKIYRPTLSGEKNRIEEHERKRVQLYYDYKKDIMEKKESIEAEIPLNMRADPESADPITGQYSA